MVLSPSMETTTRRAFLVSALSVAGGYLGLRALQQRAAADSTSIVGKGWGLLHSTADQSTGLHLLKLPEGFSYHSFGWTRDPMTTGEATPAAHDGMAVIAERDGELVLMRNHEVVWKPRPFTERAPIFDPKVGAGTTRLRFDARQGRWLDSSPTLSGTLANCAGGPTPWGSWLSCEEVVADVDGRLGPLFSNRTVALEEKHGYVFEVPADGEPMARPLVDMGRFRHEAAAVDPDNGVVYLTEDNKPVSGVYRFLPEEPGRLAEGGRLQMMRVVGRADMRCDLPLLRPFDVDWVDIDDPDAGHNPDTLDSAAVYSQGKRQGGSTFSRVEGCWLDAEGRVWLGDTAGGNAERGQVFVFDPAEQRIQLVFESPSPAILDHPDNLTVSPDGAMVVVCEDRPIGVQRIQVITQDGHIVQLAHNNVVLAGQRNGFRGDFRNAEWAGASFSPDGRWLFVNVQKPGITFAITGPWRDGLQAPI